MLVKTADIWWPDDVGITNAYFNENHHTASGHATVRPDGSCYLSQVHTMRINCVMDFQDFPFDKQECPITLESWLHNDQWLKIQHKPDGVQQFLDSIFVTTSTNEFKIRDGGSITNTYSTDSGDYTQLKWILKMERHTSFFFTMVFIPCTLLNLLVWLSTFIDPNAAPARVAVCITAILTITALRIPIAAYVPVVDYDTWMSQYLSGSLAFGATMLCEYCLINYWLKKGERPVKMLRWLPACCYQTSDVRAKKALYSDPDAVSRALLLQQTQNSSSAAPTPTSGGFFGQNRSKEPIAQVGVEVHVNELKADGSNNGAVDLDDALESHEPLSPDGDKQIIQYQELSIVAEYYARIFSFIGLVAFVTIMLVMGSQK